MFEGDTSECGLAFVRDLPGLAPDKTKRARAVGKPEKGIVPPSQAVVRDGVTVVNL